MPQTRRVFVPVLAAAVLVPIGCSRLYYAANEKLGREKRDILKSRVEDGRKEQAKAKEQFQTALETFQQVTGFSGGDLESVYKKLDKEFQRSEDRAKEVRDSVESIEKVARDLFREWDNEIGQMRNREFRTKSQQIRQDTERRYNALVRKMRESEHRMEPVLTVFRDQVLFLKHNLNARAISSLKKNVLKLDKDVTALIGDIEASIAESDAFIKSLNDQETES